MTYQLLQKFKEIIRLKMSMVKELTLNQYNMFALKSSEKFRNFRLGVILPAFGIEKLVAGK